MALIDGLVNIRYWVAGGLLFGLAVGNFGVAGPWIIILALMVLMTISLSGLELKREDIYDNRKNLVLAMVLCYVVSTGALLLTGLFFRDLWDGWVMIAAVPCAVSVVSSTLLMRGDVKLALVSVTMLYLAGLAITPVLTSVLIGSAVSPLEILKYVVLFILVPIILSIPMKKINIPVRPRNIVINICFFILVAIAFGTNREFLFDRLDTAAWMAVACVVRLVVLFFAVELLLKKLGVPRMVRIVMVLIAVWRNTSLGMTLTMLLVPQPEAALPAAILIPIEMVWLIFMMWYYDKVEPPLPDASPAPQTEIIPA